MSLPASSSILADIVYDPAGLGEVAVEAGWTTQAHCCPPRVIIKGRRSEGFGQEPSQVSGPAIRCLGGE